MTAQLISPITPTGKAEAALTLGERRTCSERRINQCGFVFDRRRKDRRKTQLQAYLWHQAQARPGRR